MKRTLALLTAGTVLAATPALAGNIAEPTPEPAVTPAPPLNVSPDWTGFYGGAELGYANVDGSGSTFDGDGAIGGLTAGYDYDLGNWVVGGALDYDFADISVSPGVSVDNIFRAKLRGGYKIGKGLLYATGGYANIDTDGLGDDDGYFIGGGYEHRVTDQVSVAGEVLYHKVNDFGGGPGADDLEATTVQVRATYRF